MRHWQKLQQAFTSLSPEAISVSSFGNIGSETCVTFTVKGLFTGLEAITLTLSLSRPLNHSIGNVSDEPKVIEVFPVSQQNGRS